MGLKERLLARRDAAGNTGNTGNVECVTGKTVIEQGGNTGSTGNTDFEEVGAKEDTDGVSGGENLSRDPLLSLVTLVTGVTGLKTKAKSGNKVGAARVTGVTDALVPAGPVALGQDDPGDHGLGWVGEAQGAAPPKPEPAWWRPKLLPQGSLHARLVAAGATINTYGSKASVRAPAGIPAELVQEVEARGWAIIPGGKPNPEAEHDSWLAGVPVAELKP